MLPSYAPRAMPLRSGQIRKHRAFTMDASIIKNTQITERLRIQFRAEAFNLLNTTNLGTPAGVLGAASFGTITSAFDPRVLQFALKFVF